VNIANFIRLYLDDQAAPQWRRCNSRLLRSSDTGERILRLFMGIVEA
jgi:hypothetical protein